MKYNPISLIGTILIVLFYNFAQAQSFGTSASAVWISDCNQSNFYNTSGAPANLIGPAGNVFENMNFGAHTQNSGTLILRGAQVKTTKDPLSSNVCNVRMFYRVYPQSGVAGSFSSIDLPLFEDCNVASGVFPSGGLCTAGGQKWQRIINDGVTTPYAPVNLTGYAAGNYVLEVYYEVSGSNTSTSLCNDLVTLNNGGTNYKAFFSIQSPTLSSTNPSSCFGNQGSITIGGLVPGASYQLSYIDDGAAVGPTAYVANGAGQVIITGLNKGFYASFSLEVNGCTTNLFTGLILSDPIFMPTFTPIAAFCAGTTPPTLPAASNNGITGTWSPAIVDNQTTGTYTFTPSGNQCGFPISVTINVIQRTTPTFSFGTSSTICAGGIVPTLPASSTNGISGTWSPSVVDNQNAGTYTFTPNPGQCANGTTFTLSVVPNVTPTFGFATNSTICQGGAVPTLATTSTNGITGTWSPSVADNQNTGTYTFTPTAGQCANSTAFTITVDPNSTPTFSFGTSLSVCAGSPVPTLPNTSINAITGSWSPAVIDNQTSGTYTFTPDAGICATPATLSVSVSPNISPTFSFGTSLTICSGAAVPVLATTSNNGITGTWSPSVIDNQNSGTYTFTPDAGQCATTTTLTVATNPNITPTFSFGTASTICAGATTPALVTASTNGINGSWSPSVIDNQSSGTYTFTPDAGQCATTTSFTLTVDPNVTPTFSFGTSATICAGSAVPTLSTTSGNGITGSWSPAVVSDQTSGTYTFTPTAGQCAATTSFTLTVTPNITPMFSIGTASSICAGGTAPVLPTTSGNSITGTWSPSGVDNQNSGTYTFTPDAGQCATTATFTLTVSPNITPTFGFGTASTICAGSTAPALVTASTNGINGTWSPSIIDNQNSGTYTFTPDAGQCATTTSFTLTVNPNLTPTFSFGTSATICAGSAVPTLSTTSGNGITGSWSPAVVSDQTSGTYTFTPTTGQCATTTSFTLTVTPNITPTFSIGTASSICAGGTAPVLPTISANGISGTWSPSVVDNQNSGTYTFTPAAGPCATTATFTLTVDPNITPSFSFGTNLMICSGAAVPTLTSTSMNGIGGTWSPAAIDNQNSGTYTFTPDAGQCATTTSLTITVSSNVTPSFGFGTSLSICAGATVPVLPTTSTNGIAGSWSPATVNNQANGVYTFTPANGLCATTTTFTVTVNPNITPTFSFGRSLAICDGGIVPALPTTSANGITGTWNPSVVDNRNSHTYIFTPDAGLCATSTTFAVTVSPNVTPTFSFGTSATICAGGAVPVLATTSANGISGTWSPSVVDNQSGGMYTFTPAAGQCVTPGVTTFTLSVTPNAIPAFNFGPSLSICAGAGAPVLPAISNNGISGTWSPSVVSNTASGKYVFTGAPGQCVTTFTLTVTVNPIIKPAFGIGTFQSVCIGSAVPPLPLISGNGISGTWSPTLIADKTDGTYVFTPDSGQCADTTSFTYQVNDVPSVAVITNNTINDGTLLPVFDFIESPGAKITWSNSNPSIGLPASGTGNLPAFTAVNKGNDPITAAITVIPAMNGCTGTAQRYNITVLALNKDVFVPNVFSPNSDGKNDALLVYGNYIDKLEMRIFNQWGQQVGMINSRTQGWNGTHKGNPQPVGVYVYVLRAVLSDGRTVELKGSFTLLR